AAPLPLELDSQEVDAVAARQDRVEAVGDFDSQPLNLRREQRRRPTDDHMRAELRQSPDVRSRHAAVRNIADQCDRQPGKRTAMLPNREEVEQALCGMFVSSVARIEDAGPEMLRE